MLKLVRLALTAAIVTAIVVRLRRRARMRDGRPAPPPAGPVRRTRVALAWAAIAVAVAVTLVGALVPASAGRATPAGPVAVAVATPADPKPVSRPSPTPAPVPDPHCSPAPRPVTVRPVDPEVRRAVDRQWRRIERWLRANAPRTYRSLRPPAKARTIAIAEAQMGVDFPDDLRASLLRHNGARGADAFGFGFWFDGARNLGIRQIRDTWREMCRWQNMDPGTEYWDGRMIPYLYYRGLDPESTQYAVVDSATGAVAWDDTIGGMAPRATSYYALMRAVAGALEQGTSVDGWRPAVERGTLRWEEVS